MRTPAFIVFCLLLPCVLLVDTTAAKDDVPRPDAVAIIEELELIPLPEAPGAFFRETYRSPCTTTNQNADAKRDCASLIYFLLEAGVVDPWHRITSDEIFEYYAGSALIQLLLFADGSWEERVIGPDILAGDRPQSIVPAGTWMAMTMADRTPDSWGLYGVWVVPGFHYDDHTQGRAQDLARDYPDAEQRMRELGMYVDGPQASCPQ